MTNNKNFYNENIITSQISFVTNNKKILELCSADSLSISSSKQFDSTLISINLENNFDKNDFPQHLMNDKFDIIILNNILEFIPKPIDFLKIIFELLSEHGFLICTITNISHIIKKLEFLDSSFNSIQFFNKNQINFFTLDTFISILATANFSVIDLKRLTQELDLTQSTIKSYNLSQELIDSILKDPESTVTNYIFKIIPNTVDNEFLKKNSLQFPKQYILESIYNYYNYYKEYLVKMYQDREVNYTKEITDLQQQLSDLQQREVNYTKEITDLQQREVNYTKEITDLQQREVNYTKEITDLQQQLFDLRQNKALRLLKKWDELRGK